MTRPVIELTNCSSLRCQHCFDARHAATGERPLALIEKVLVEGKSCGIDQLACTGGAPTLHRQFAAIVRAVCATDYAFSFVSDGSTLPGLNHFPCWYCVQYLGKMLRLGRFPQHAWAHVPGTLMEETRKGHARSPGPTVP
jgi:hypothetical protein